MKRLMQHFGLKFVTVDYALFSLTNVVTTVMQSKEYNSKQLTY